MKTSVLCSLLSALLAFNSVARAQGLATISNGSMTAGAQQVEGWSDVKTEQGQAQAVRDTHDFVKGPASLRLESIDGVVRGASVTQTIQRVAPGQTLKITGHVKAAGQVEFAAVAVITPGAATSWHQLTSFAQSNRWTPFASEITIPEGSQLALIMLFMHGSGSVWLDELAVGLPSESSSLLVTDFDQPPNFSYLAFEKSVTVQQGVVHVIGATGQGGTGFLTSLDLSSRADHSPALWVQVGPNNQARQIKMFLAGDNESKRMFSYSLEGATKTEFTRLLPIDGLAISPALTNEDAAGFDPAKITVVQIQGDWTNEQVDVWLDKIELVPPTANLLAMRTAYGRKMVERAEQLRREDARQREELARLLAGAPHPANGPDVVHVCAVAPNMLAITITDGTILPQPQFPYAPQPGDKISIGQGGTGAQVLQWSRGQIVDAPLEKSVARKTAEDDSPATLGFLIKDDTIVAPGPKYEGLPLTLLTVQEPEAYRITSSEDPAFAASQPPVNVFCKCKPTGQANNQIPVRCTVYLQLDSTLQSGATYVIELRGVNTRQAVVSYKHDPRTSRSEAIHITHTGYKPADPWKRAYLSTWLGTGGSLRYDSTAFELIDQATGESVYRGNIQLGFAADQVESMRGGKNHTQTAVYYLDFHDFQRPGNYLVSVPGIGTSYPFSIDEQVWRKAFVTSMHGFLSHRNGIALGPPFTDYQRPRPMHPEDGFKIFQLDITYWTGEAEAVDRSMRRLLGHELDTAQLALNPNAWGGYMDAGDWDRRSQHLTCTLMMMELYELFPSYFSQQKLALPPSEANDPLPDLLNEALWNLDCYRRLQSSDGGVGGGIESTSHPKPGEASWQESLLLGTFAPDPETSLRYAACAARAARLLKDHDRVLSQMYAESAHRAWTWANTNEQRVLDAEVQRQEGRSKNSEALRQAVRKMRALAAVELLHLTGDTAYDAAFRAASWLGSNQGDPGTELDALFAYARLPAELGDKELKMRAAAWFEQAAQQSREFARNNAFNITCRVPQLPMIGFVAYYSVPETAIGCVLPRAHYLTGKQQYLAAAIAAAQFSAGANPMNMTLTTGVGHEWPQHPLHVDSQHAGMLPPVGITVYGNSDPTVSDGSTDWAHTWFLNKTMIPPSRTWPAAEFYVDLGNWPPMNEYTVHQTLGPVSYYWGYLAAQGSRE